MIYLYRRKKFLLVLFLLIIIKSCNLSDYNLLKLNINENVSKSAFKENDTSSISIILRKAHFEYEDNVGTNDNNTSNLYTISKFVFLALFILKVLITDRRKQILVLITRYFEGSKYKDLRYLY
jgi:ATP-dependent phosphoenolpyruvate carboxykinase